MPNAVNQAALCIAVTLSAAALFAADRGANPDQTVTIQGQVVDENDRPLSAVDVSAGAPAMGTTLWWAQESSRVRTDDDGQFKLTLPFGELLYSLQTQRLGFDSPSTQIVATPDRGKEPIKLRMRRGLHAKLQGRVVDSDLKPVADLPLTLVGEYGFSKKSKTNGAGEFLFNDVPEYIGQAVVVAHAKGRAIPQGIVRRADLGDKGLELQLSPAGKLEGEVVDSITGAAIKDAEVSIRPWFSSGFSLKARSDAKGRFAIEEVPTGSYLIEPSAAAHFDKPPRGMAHDRERVTILPGETVTRRLPMQQCAVVRGKIMDPEGRAVAAAIVGLPCTWEGDYRNQVRFVRTDASGAFELATGHLAEESLRLSAFSARFGGADLELAPLAEGEVREGLAIKLPGAVRVRGVVSDSKDRPIAGVICASGVQNLSVESSDDGSFDLGRITLTKNPLSLDLRAPRPSAVSWFVSMHGSKVLPDAPVYYRDTSVSFDAKAGEEVNLKPKLEPTELLVFKGRVSDKGKPVKGAKLYLFAGNASETWTDQAIPERRSLGSTFLPIQDRMLADAATDAEGRFRMKAVRFDGEETKFGTRYSIGVVIGTDDKQLVQDVVLAKDKSERELEIQLGE